MRKKIIILLVEDNPGDAFLLEEMLAENGEYAFEINSVTTLGDAVNELRKTAFDIVLLDLGLPDSQGISALEVILRMELPAPVLVITGLNDEETGRKAVSLGAQGYLVKGELNSRIIVHSILYSIERNEHLLKIRKKEKELQEKNKLLIEANRTKNTLISIISHDLKGPFGSVVELLEYLNSDAHDINSEERARIIRSCLSSAKTTFRLTSNLLAWAVTQTSKRTVARKTLKLHMLVYSGLETLVYEAKRKEIKLEIHVPEEISIVADEDMISTVIRNIVSNAIKFTPRKGVIEISASEAIIKDKISFCVRDSGVGIDKEKLNGLFDLYNIGSAPGTENESGSGLGLILCKELLELNDGGIKIESGENEGTTVCITLPEPEKCSAV